jgi:hypothetical protein
MEQSVRLWLLGAVAILFIIASIVLNLLLVTSINDEAVLSGLRTLLFVSFGISVAAIVALLYYNIHPVRQLRAASLRVTRTTWWVFLYGAGVAAIAHILSGVVLVWSTIRREDLPTNTVHDDAIVLLGIWFAAWGVSLGLQTAFYTLLGIWIRNSLKRQSLGRLDLDFGIRPMQMDEVRSASRATHQSFPSQDITLHSPPRTPTSHVPSTRRSSATKVGTTSSSKIKLVKGSAKSSMDLPAWPAGEAVSIDSAFDSWDTSSVHCEMRAAVHSSPTYRQGLETIPGSRAESPANALDGPFLPSSPHAASSETAEAIGWDPASSFRHIASSPPSSPPNFSRPTSRPSSSHQTLGLAPAFEPGAFDAKRSSIQDLIHPLFRPDNSEPAPVAGPGTMVTASPTASQPITPKTLARLRSRSESQGHWRAMPSIDYSDRPSTSGSVMSSLHGSPGPSIVDEEEHTVILPAFVMTAGQRSSMLGYGKRKSMKKERRQSQLSVGSRLSQVMM